MSDFWDNLGKVLNDAACKAVKASGNAVELTKTSVNIKLDEIKRESYFKEIGKLVYECYIEDPASVCDCVLVYCKCIDEIETAIDENKIKAAELKNKKYCVGCGLLLDRIAAYCYSCGAKQPEIVEEACDCGCGEEAEVPECCCEDEGCCPAEDVGCCEESESSCETESESCCDGDSCEV